MLWVLLYKWVGVGLFLLLVPTSRGSWWISYDFFVWFSLPYPPIIMGSVDIGSTKFRLMESEIWYNPDRWLQFFVTLIGFGLLLVKYLLWLQVLQCGMGRLLLLWLGHCYYWWCVGLKIFVMVHWLVYRDFASGPVLEIPCFHCKGLRFSPHRETDPACPEMQTKIKKKKKLNNDGLNCE